MNILIDFNYYTIIAFISSLCYLIFLSYNICKAYYHNMYGSQFTWPIMPGGYALTTDQYLALQLKYKKEKK